MTSHNLVLEQNTSPPSISLSLSLHSPRPHNIPPITLNLFLCISLFWMKYFNIGCTSLIFSRHWVIQFMYKLFLFRCNFYYIFLRIKGSKKVRNSRWSREVLLGFDFLGNFHIFISLKTTIYFITYNSNRKWQDSFYIEDAF